MYARPGTAYVYFTYGMHHCFNVACEDVEIPAAVLIRALEPVEGLDEMTTRRGPQTQAKSQHRTARSKQPAPKSTTAISRRSAATPSSTPPAPHRALTKAAARFLCGGPGKLCAALAIDRTLDGLDLCTSSIIRIEPGTTIADKDIVTSPRIGIGDRGAWTRRELRFFIRDHPGVSR
jgi:DNA-3-methyladenine glycosylase